MATDGALATESRDALRTPTHNRQLDLTETGARDATPALRACRSGESELPEGALVPGARVVPRSAPCPRSGLRHATPTSTTSRQWGYAAVEANGTIRAINLAGAKLLGVELHGGSIHARSHGHGLGSEFWVRLPLATTPAESVPATEVTEATSTRRVLLVEDNADSCESLSVALELSGHRVRAAHDGRSAIAVAHAFRPDVVLCDIGLPDMDGYEVARRLRAEEPFRSTRLIALSGYSQPEDKARSQEAGFDLHISKPPELSELTKILAMGT